jgi:hypothetical protein
MDARRLPAGTEGAKIDAGWPEGLAILGTIAPETIHRSNCYSYRNVLKTPRPFIHVSS